MDSSDKGVPVGMDSPDKGVQAGMNSPGKGTGRMDSTAEGEGEVD